MKSSPLRLKWVNYPSASFEMVEDYEGDTSAAIEADVDAEVRYNPNEAEHFVYLRVSSKDGADAPYRFSITSVAGFEFDLDIARREYRPPATPALMPVIAVNVARVVYAGVREYLAMITSRSTYGAAVLDSVLLEPRDVQINSIVSPADILRHVFQASEEEIAELMERIQRSTLQSEGASASSSEGVPASPAASKRKRSSSKT